MFSKDSWGFSLGVREILVFFYSPCMEDITRGWSCLSLSGSEGDGFRLSNEMGSVEFILDAKFFTKSVLNSDAIARNFK